MMIKHCRSQWNRNEQRYPLDKRLQLLIRRFGEISISLVCFFPPCGEEKSKCPSILNLLQKKLLLYTCPVWKTIQPLPLNKSSSRRSYTLFDNTMWDRTPILVFIYYYTYCCCCCCYSIKQVPCKAEQVKVESKVINAKDSVFIFKFNWVRYASKHAQKGKYICYP